MDEPPASGLAGLGLDPAYLRACLSKIVELPRTHPTPDSLSEPDPFGSQRFGAFAGLFHRTLERPEPVIWGWHRVSRSGPVELLTSEPDLAPPGSRLVPSAGAADTLAAVDVWVPIAIRSSAIAPTEDDGSHGTGGRSPSTVESVLLPVWDRPFTLLLTAYPVLPTEAEEAVFDVGQAVEHAGSRRDAIPELRVDHDRLSRWHREMLNGAATGLWWVQLLVGAQSPGDARTVAGLTVASFPATRSGYNLIPTRPGYEGSLSFAPNTDTVVERADNRGERGFMAGTGLLSLLCRPPSREIPGVRQVLPSDFDTNPESVVQGRTVELGAVLDAQRRPAGTITVPLRAVNRHTLIAGATGSGKSVTGRTLVHQLVRAGIPVTVIEPAKAEWSRTLAARFAEGGYRDSVVRIAPGDPDQVACCIDPLRPVDGFPLQTHIDLTRSLFLAAFDADEPFPQVLSAALQRAYEDQGWHTLLSRPVLGTTPDSGARYPTLRDLQTAARRVVDEIGYGPEVHQNIQGFVKVRLEALRLGTTGRFLEGGHPLDMGRLLDSNVVLEIQDVGDDAEKAFVIGAFLLKLTEYYRVKERRGELIRDTLRHVTVIEEAHRLLRNPDGHAGAANNAVELFASMLSEVRAYGEGIVIAEQIPSKLIPDAIKNSSVKIIHRLPAKDDRDVVGATMNLDDDQSAFLVTVHPGEAAVFSDGMDRPLLARITDGTRAEQAAHAVPVSQSTVRHQGERPANGLHGPDELIEPAFGRCGADYRLGGVELSRVVVARQRVENDVLLRWWAELTVLAHLTGWSAPVFQPGALDLPEAKVVVAYAVDEAVAARSSGIRDRMSPDTLASHVAESMIGAAFHGRERCPHEHRWAAAPFLWEKVYHELRDHREDEGPELCGRRHPSSDIWRVRYGREIPGHDCNEQLGNVDSWRRELQGTPVVRDIVFGTEQPSALECSIGLTRSDAVWSERVHPLLTALTAPWAMRLLRA